MPGHFISMDYMAAVAFEDLLKRIENKRVIFVGEIHSNPSSHRVQLEVIRHLVDSGKDVSIAIEIFPAAQQQYLDNWLSGVSGRDRFVRVFKQSVKMPYEAYEHIFEYARGNKIPIVGIDASREVIADVSKQGIKAVPAALLKRVKFTECVEDPDYMGLLGFSGKREYHQTGMPFLCEAQRLRDAVMAYNISRIIHENASTIVVMTGMMHAAKIAVPEMLQKHTLVDYAVLMPKMIISYTNAHTTTDVADYVWY
jgi:uncharacterized iron-regulated protein